MRMKSSAIRAISFTSTSRDRASQFRFITHQIRRCRGVLAATNPPRPSLAALRTRWQTSCARNETNGNEGAMTVSRLDESLQKEISALEAEGRAKAPERVI